MNALLELDFGDFVAFFVQQERSHIHRHLAMHRCRVVFLGLFLNDPQNLQR
jgi:hypothetical protein